jgi:DtxR family Mn-dependent transcriptional regulator
MSGRRAAGSIECELRAALGSRQNRTRSAATDHLAASQHGATRIVGKEEHAVNDLIDTTEMYLRIIFELEEEGIVPLRARIAERLNQSGPTVSQTVARMERDGLLVLSGDRHLQLTDMGRQRATSVMRKHRLAERLLLDVIGLDWAEVHVEACRWEHVMSDAVESRLVELLDDPHISPYGNPIPPADHSGMTPIAPGTPADEVAAGGTVKVVRIIETVQNEPEIMAKLHAAGIVPGAEVTLDGGAAEGWMTITGPTGSIDVSAETATGIRVKAA